MVRNEKIVFILSITAVILSMTAFFTAQGASAYATMKVGIGAGAGAPGETVSVPVTITTDRPLGDFSILCEYDASRLEYCGVDFTPVDQASSKRGYGIPTNGDPVYDYWYNQGNYVSFAWASAVSGGEVIAAGGLIVVNMQFKIKDGAPLGDAYVKISKEGAVNASGNTVYGTLVSFDGEVAMGDTISCGNGKVMVLSAGIFDVTPTDEADFTINASGTLTTQHGYRYQVSW